jgi:acyl-CoA synthetase (AMP-forming)/AMP-acid ligase II
MSSVFNYGFVSADSHVTEPPDCYTDYIDPAFRDRAPHIVHDDKRGDVYVIPGLNTMSVPMGLVAAAGEESHQMTFAGREWGEEVKAVVQLDKIPEEPFELAQELIDYSRERIAHFKCPRSIDFADTLPRDDNGKLYRHRLLEVYRT